MKNKTNTLPKLNLVTQMNIKSSIVSIYKINKEHHLFITILEKNPELHNAEYIIYPNMGNSSKIFLTKEGEEILSYKEGVSEFILLPCEFDF